MGQSAANNLPTGNLIFNVICADLPMPLDFSKLVVRLKRYEEVNTGLSTGDHIYFPIDLLMSLRCLLSNGVTAEFGQVGSEGLVGWSAIMDANPAVSSAVALTPGLAYRLEASLVRKAFDRSPRFRRTLLTFMMGHMQESAQLIVCSKHHSIAQQVSRSLLMASDRLGSPTINLTHEQLALGLGCRREAVSLAAAQLKASRVIQYNYGKVAIIDRALLEHSSCECYTAIRRGFAPFLAETASERRDLKMTGFQGV